MAPYSFYHLLIITTITLLAAAQDDVPINYGDYAWNQRPKQRPRAGAMPDISSIPSSQLSLPPGAEPRLTSLLPQSHSQTQPRSKTLQPITRPTATFYIHLYIWRTSHYEWKRYQISTTDYTTCHTLNPSLEKWTTEFQDLIQKPRKQRPSVLDLTFSFPPGTTPPPDLTIQIFRTDSPKLRQTGPPVLVDLETRNTRKNDDGNGKFLLPINANGFGYGYGRTPQQQQLRVDRENAGANLNLSLQSPAPLEAAVFENTYCYPPVSDKNTAEDKRMRLINVDTWMNRMDQKARDEWLKPKGWSPLGRLFSDYRLKVTDSFVVLPPGGVGALEELQKERKREEGERELKRAVKGLGIRYSG